MMFMDLKLEVILIGVCSCQDKGENIFLSKLVFIGIDILGNIYLRELSVFEIFIYMEVIGN